MSCRQHGYPWPSLATSPYHSSPPAGLMGYILCPHIAAVCKFGLVVLLLLGHMWGSIGVRHLRARPCFSSSVRQRLLIIPKGSSITVGVSNPSSQATSGLRVIFVRPAIFHWIDIRLYFKWFTMWRIFEIEISVGIHCWLPQEIYIAKREI